MGQRGMRRGGAERGRVCTIVGLEQLENRRMLSAGAASTGDIALAPAGAVQLDLAEPAAAGPEQPSVTWIPSPNYNSRSGTAIDSIVIHTTEGSYAGTISWFQNTASQVSAHYVIDSNGAITQMVDLANRAWHATYYNSRSIGIEMVGYAGQASTWNAQNLAALTKLVSWLAWKYNVKVVHPAGDAYDYPNDTFDAPGIVAHAQVQPWNRTDPGPYFPWSTFINDVKATIAASQQGPFHGAPFAIGTAGSTTIQAEDYDTGGEGVAYHDTAASNDGDASYRAGDGVDIKAISSTSGQYRISSTKAGEWTEYSISVSQAGSYKLDVRLSSPSAGAAMNVSLDGASLTGSWSVPDTGSSWNSFATLSRTVTLPAGQHVLRLATTAASTGGSGGSYDWMRFSPIVQPPAGGTTIKTDTGAYVRGGSYAGQNFGDADPLVVKRASTSTNTREGYLKFDLSSIGSLSSAKLRLYGRLADSQDASVGIDVYKSSNTSWSESTLTYDNRPATSGSRLAGFAVSGTSSQWYEIDLTSFLKSELSAGRKVVTLVFKGHTSTSTQALFASDESVNGPQLLIA